MKIITRVLTNIITIVITVILITLAVVNILLDSGRFVAQSLLVYGVG